MSTLIIKIIIIIVTSQEGIGVILTDSHKYIVSIGISMCIFFYNGEKGDLYPKSAGKVGMMMLLKTRRCC